MEYGIINDTIKNNFFVIYEKINELNIKNKHIPFAIY